MRVEQIDGDNYEAVVAFLSKEKEDIDSWSGVLKRGLFRICVVDEKDEIECVFIFEDYPASLIADHEAITKSNWTRWLRECFEVPTETFHMLWLTKWHTVTARKFDVDCMSLVMSSLFISNFEIECILVGVAAASPSGAADSESSSSFDFAFQMLFHPLHRVQRTKRGQSAKAAVPSTVNLFYCPSSKILPAIQVTAAKVEHFDDLMPLFQHNAQSLKDKHGEFFVAELIESSESDPRLQTLVALSNEKPVGFCCLTTNLDLLSLRNSYHLEQFNDLEEVDLAAETLKYDNKAQLERQRSVKHYDSEQMLAMCRATGHFAEFLSSRIMKCFTEREWVTEQEELLRQSADDDDHYIEFMELASPKAVAAALSASTPICRWKRTRARIRWRCGLICIPRGWV